jgi:hypothetical protein
MSVYPVYPVSFISRDKKVACDRLYDKQIRCQFLTGKTEKTE